MKLLLVPDGHYIRDKAGNVYVSSVFNYNFFRRYLYVFREVGVLARVTDVDVVPKNMQLASGDGVIFESLPSYVGVKGYLFKRKQVIAKIRAVIKKYDCAIFRLPGATANVVCKYYSKIDKPYAIEVVTDPWTHFSPGTINGITRPIVRIVWTYELKRYCKKANGVSYVTEKYLQKKYPSNRNKEENFQSFYSSVSLPDDVFSNPKKYISKKKFIISHVANSFTSYGKGHIQIIEAISIVKQRGFDVSVVFVGDGYLRDTFEKFAIKKKVKDKIVFTGRLSDSSAVQQVLENSDLFVFPSLSEGLPRALLEAMAAGLPCISSPICGIPEILDENWLVDYYDVEELARKIIKMISNIESMELISKNNIETAKKYKESELNKKRIHFYTNLRQVTENKSV